MPVSRDSSDVIPVPLNWTCILSINIVQIARMLKEYGFIDGCLALNLEQMQVNGGSPEQLLHHFLLTFFHCYRYPIDSVLEQIQNEKLRFQFLELVEFARLNVGRMQKIWRVDSDQLGHRQFLNNFYRILKRFHNDPKNSYKERIVLFNRFEKQISRAIRLTNDAEKQMHLIDKKVVLIAAYIDFLTIKYKNDLPSYAIFEKLRKLNYQRNAGASSTLIPEIVYCQRKGIALAIAGEFEKGEELINHFEFLISNFDIPCREFGNKCYFRMYFNLWKYEKYPTEDLKQSIIADGKKGLGQDGMCSYDSREFWKTPLLIKMIYCLLGIGNRGNPFSVPGVLDDDIRKAEEYIGCINFKASSMRREMQLLVAKARIFELKLEYSGALKIVAAAKDIALQGQYEEVNTITEYQKQLEMAMSAISVSSLDWSGLLGSGICDLYYPMTVQSLPYQTNVDQLDEYNNELMAKRANLNPFLCFKSTNSDLQKNFDDEKMSTLDLSPNVFCDWSGLLKANSSEKVSNILSHNKSERKYVYIYEIQSNSKKTTTCSTYKGMHFKALDKLVRLTSSSELHDVSLRSCPVLTDYRQWNVKSSFGMINEEVESAFEHYETSSCLLVISPKEVNEFMSSNKYLHAGKCLKHQGSFHLPFEVIEDDELFGDNTIENKNKFESRSALYDSSDFQSFSEDSLFHEPFKHLIPWEDCQKGKEKDDGVDKTLDDKSFELLHDVDLRLDSFSV
ncbi:hypothetical protein FSP39_019754 [Pinctada imbricata]|uniref:Uncharacterized protein n=1 Tax=Pinctada imbricata TaxID=66713 RepID=A0AA88YF76_PINIB|nr:hypothetical protein FSP39_019754 [Pinctada imbricata]